MTSVVTGASGHLGGTLVRALLEQGGEVRAVDLVEGPALSGLGVEYRHADILDAGQVGRAIEGARVVYHMAGKISVAGDPDGSVYRTNVEGVRVVAAATAAAGARLVHTSSVHAFDLVACRGSTVTETSPRAVSPSLPPYDRSKHLGEEAVRALVEEGLDAVIINPTGVIGPFDFGPSRMGQVFLGLRHRRLPFTVPGGFDWVDVRDVAAGAIAAAARGRRGENYLLAGTRLTVGDLTTLAAGETGRRPPVVVPMWLARMWGPVGTVVARRTGSAWALTSESLHALSSDPVVSSEKAKVELGHAPRSVSETIHDLYRWFASMPDDGRR